MHIPGSFQYLKNIASVKQSETRVTSQRLSTQATINILKKLGCTWLISFCLFIHPSFADSDLITKVISLNYQNADKIIQLVQPILQNGEQITGSGQTLIVKVSPDTLTQLRVILHKLDVPPVSFQITIHQGDINWLNNQDDNSISISTNGANTEPQNQSVTVMNGESAFVSTGQDQPVLSSAGIGFWQSGVSYDRRLVQNGLLVAPELQGQQVKLSLRRVRQQDSQASNQSFDQQQVMTTIMVPLNQWVPLASAQNGEPMSNSNSQVISAGNQYSQNSTLFVKVNVIQP